MEKPARLRYGYQKYTAICLILARWRHCTASARDCFKYVTLGGTELKDVRLLHWIDSSLASEVLSFEVRKDRWELAQTSIQSLQEIGLRIEVCQSDIFNYRRVGDCPHVFFIDLQGICKPIPYKDYFKTWLEEDVLVPGDFLLITSSLGRNIGWNRVLQPFDAEFRLLGIDTSEKRKQLYRDAHPLFVLRRSLRAAGMEDEIEIACAGHVRYRDSSTMGLYGITISEGATDLRRLVSDFPRLYFTAPDWATRGSVFAPGTST